jgi:hypothetical protein
MVLLGGGLGYRVLICRPVQGSAGRVDLKVIVSASQPVVSFPIKESSSACAVLLVGGGLDAIHAIRQISQVHSAGPGR